MHFGWNTETAAWAQASATFLAIAFSLCISTRSIRAQTRREEHRVHQERVENVARATVFIDSAESNILALKGALEYYGAQKIVTGPLRYTVSAIRGDHDGLRECLLGTFPSSAVLMHCKAALQEIHAFQNWLREVVPGDTPQEYHRVMHHAVSRLKVFRDHLTEFTDRFAHNPKAKFELIRESQQEAAERIRNRESPE